MSFAPNRILASVVPQAKPRIRALLSDCDLDFVDSYADAALAIKSHRYAAALIGVHLGAPRVASLVELIRHIQPDVRILVVSGVEPAAACALAPPDGARLEGPFDLSRDPLPESAARAMATLLARCDPRR